MNRATAQPLQARVKMLSFIFDLVNVPWPFFYVTPASEADVRQGVAQTMNFVEYRIGGCRQLASLMPLPADGLWQPSNAWPLHLPSTQQQRLRPTLFIQNKEEAEWFQEAVIGDLEECDKFRSDVDVDDVRPSQELHGSAEMDDLTVGSGPKFKSAFDITCTILNDFMTDRCLDNLKEKELSKQLAKLLKIQHEVLNAPVATTWGMRLASCVNAVASGKKTMAPLSMYLKRYECDKLIVVDEAAQKLREFFADQNFHFGPKMSVIFWRAAFQKAARSQVSAAFDKLKADEPMLLELFGGKIEQVQALISDEIANVVKSFLCCEETSAKHNENVRDELATQVRQYLDVLNTMPLFGRVQLRRGLVRCHRRLGCGDTRVERDARGPQQVQASPCQGGYSQGSRSSQLNAWGLGHRLVLVCLQLSSRTLKFVCWQQPSHPMYPRRPCLLNVVRGVRWVVPT